jgi:hypothetical protein
MTHKKMCELIQQGRGMGHGRSYLPWLMLRRKNPSPNSNQAVSWVPPLERTAHYFSRGEYHTALLLLWLGVKDLRELNRHEFSRHSRAVGNTAFHIQPATSHC